MRNIIRKIAHAVNPPPLPNDVELDEPFSGAIEVNRDPIVTVARIDSVIPGIAVSTPMGDEIVHQDDCDSITRVYPKGYFDSIRNDACPHRHGTVPAMEAVKAG